MIKTIYDKDNDDNESDNKGNETDSNDNDNEIANDNNSNGCDDKDNGNDKDNDPDIDGNCVIITTYTVMILTDMNMRVYSHCNIQQEKAKETRGLNDK